MEIILLERIEKLGSIGDVVSVKDGYARNYLIPKNLAQEASAGNLKAIEHQRRKWALLAQEEKNAAQKAADRVKGVKVQIEKRVGEHGHLFGSVTANEIADALMEKGIEVDKRRIELAQPIKNIGVHDVEVRLHREVSAQIQVEVVPMGVERLEEKPAEEAPAAE